MRHLRKGLSFLIFSAIVVGTGTLISVLAEDQPVTNAPDTHIGVSAPAKAQKDSDNCIADSAAIEDLHRRNLELEEKQKQLSAREAELKAREDALNDEIKKLGQIRDDIAKTTEARQKENDEKVTKLVETIESMSPKASSQMLASMDEALAVAAISRVSTQKLAKILNVMDPNRSSRLSEILAGVVRARHVSVSHDTAAITVTSTKGGESNDRQFDQQQRNSADSGSGAQKSKDNQTGVGSISR